MGKKTIKFLIISVFCFVIAIALSACGSKDNGQDGTGNQPVSSSQSEHQVKENDQSGMTGSETDQEEVKPADAELTESGKETKPKAPAKTEKEEAIPETETSQAKPEKAAKDFLTIEGSGTKNKIQFSVADLKEMTSAYVEADFFSLNNWGTKEYFSFKGVSLWYILNDKAVLNKNAQTVTITAEDGYAVSYNIEEVKRQDYINEENPDDKYPMIIAWEENGKTYDPAEGYPFRFVVGQKEAGDINKQNWVMNVKSIKVE